MKTLYRTALILISLMLLIIVMRNIDFDRLFQIFKDAGYLYYSAGIVIIFLTQFLFALRWKMTLPGYRDISYYSLFYRIITSYLFNNFFFGVFGGDLYKTLRIHKLSGKFFALFSVIYNRIINTYAAAVFPFLMLPFIIDEFYSIGFVFYSVILSGILLLLFVLTILFKTRILKFTAGKMKNPENILMIDKISLSNTMLVSLLIQMLNVTAHYFFALALNIDINFFTLAVLYSVSAVIISMPVSINGIGVREGVFIYAFSLWNISGESALAFSFLSFMSSIVLSILGGGLLIAENLKNKDKCKTGN